MTFFGLRARSCALLACLFTGRETLAQQPPAAADFAGVVQFWRIADVLQHGAEPTAAQWDSLFATPGYAALEAREHRRAAIALGIRAALSPTNVALRDSLLATNSWAARVARHVQTLPARRAALDSLAEQMRRTNVVSQAAMRAATLLPEGTVDRYGYPSVAFLFFLPDGRGYPGLIVADLANIASKPDPLPFFAHEVTHFYWAGLSRDRRARQSSRSPTPGETRLEELLMKIAEESAGDQFDKADAVALDSTALAAKHHDASWLAYLVEYKHAFEDATTQLRALDIALVHMMREPQHLREIADSVSNALPLEGRPLGMYMTRAIRRVLGDRAFAAIAGDPVAYVRAYEAAATRAECGCIALSAEAMRTIASLRSER